MWRGQSIISRYGGRKRPHKESEQWNRGAKCVCVRVCARGPPAIDRMGARASSRLVVWETRMVAGSHRRLLDSIDSPSSGKGAAIESTAPRSAVEGERWGRRSICVPRWVCLLVGMCPRSRASWVCVRRRVSRPFAERERRPRSGGRGVMALDSFDLQSIGQSIDRTINRLNYASPAFMWLLSPQ